MNYSPDINYNTYAPRVAEFVPVFPIKPNSKTPYGNAFIGALMGMEQVADGQGGYKLATTDLDIIDNIRSSVPVDALIGTPIPSNLLLIDFDTDGQDAIGVGHWLAECPEIFGEKNWYFTQSGGVHVWLKNDGFAMRTKRDSELMIDYKATGYVRLRKHSIQAMNNALPAPAAVKELWNEPVREAASAADLTPQGIDKMSRWAINSLANTKSGRNNKLNSLAHWLYGKGIDPSVLKQTALAIGLTERETDATIRSAAR